MGDVMIEHPKFIQICIAGGCVSSAFVALDEDGGVWEQTRRAVGDERFPTTWELGWRPVPATRFPPEPTSVVGPSSPDETVI